MAHASGKVAVGRADAAERLVASAESAARAAQTRGARRRAELRAGGQEHFLQRLTAETFLLQSLGYLARRRYHERIDLHALAAQHRCGGAEVGQLAPGAGAD